MRQANLFMMSAAMLLAACGGTKDAGKTDQVLIEKSDIKIEGKRMTPEALWAMGRIGGFAVSPDGKKIAYTVAYYSVPENKSNREVFVMNADGSENQQITRTPYQENEVTWIKGGTKLAFLSNDNGSSQLYEMNPDGSGRKQLTNYDGDIEGYSISPDGKKLLFISQVKTKESTADKYPDLPKATGIIVTDLMYKHWDEWVTTAPHPFVADFDGNGISNIVDILNGEPYESPMKPWGGIEQLAWNTTSDKVAYTCRKKTGLEYAISTNSDIYVYDLNTQKTENITEENKGYDTNPQYSPDGKYIAWQSMERDGYEADLNRLFIMNLETGEKRFVSKAFESNVDAFVWGADAKMIYFTGVWHRESSEAGTYTSQAIFVYIRLFCHFIDSSEIIFHTLATVVTTDLFVPFHAKSRQAATIRSNNDIIIGCHNLEIPAIRPELAYRTLRTSFTEQQSRIFLVRIKLRGIDYPCQHLFAICCFHPATFHFTHFQLVIDLFVLLCQLSGRTIQCHRVNLIPHTH